MSYRALWYLSTGKKKKADSVLRGNTVVLHNNAWYLLRDPCPC